MPNDLTYEALIIVAYYHPIWISCEARACFKSRLHIYINVYLWDRPYVEEVLDPQTDYLCKMEEMVAPFLPFLIFIPYLCPVKPIKKCRNEKNSSQMNAVSEKMLIFASAAETLPQT